MKITENGIEISSSNSIAWNDLKELKLLNKKILLTLKDGATIEYDASSMPESQIDNSFGSMSAI